MSTISQTKMSTIRRTSIEKTKSFSQSRQSFVITIYAMCGFAIFITLIAFTVCCFVKIKRRIDQKKKIRKEWANIPEGKSTEVNILKRNSFSNERILPTDHYFTRIRKDFYSNMESGVGLNLLKTSSSESITDDIDAKDNRKQKIIEK